MVVSMPHSRPMHSRQSLGAAEDRYKQLYKAQRELEATVASFLATYPDYELRLQEQGAAVVWQPGTSGIARFLLAPVCFLVKRLTGRCALIRDESLVRFEVDEDYTVTVNELLGPQPRQ